VCEITKEHKHLTLLSQLSHSGISKRVEFSNCGSRTVVDGDLCCSRQECYSVSGRDKK
jgi:hypothetical protein